MKIYKKNNNQNTGFTLVELLVVVLIISILSGLILGVLNPAGIRAKSRDAQRASDLKKLQTALELYFADNRSYFSTEGGWILVNGTNDELSTALLSGGYLTNIPSDPAETPGTETTPCTGPVDSYRYNYKSDGAYYLITAYVEVETSNDKSTCSSLNGWSSTGCASFSSDYDNYCYGVQNP